MRDDFQFVYIIHEERPSVIFGGWERAGIEMKLCSNNGIQKKNQSDLEVGITMQTADVINNPSTYPKRGVNSYIVQ